MTAMNVLSPADCSRQDMSMGKELAQPSQLWVWGVIPRKYRRKLVLYGAFGGKSTHVKQLAL